MKKTTDSLNDDSSIILIVEDNPSLRDGLALNLRLHGYQVLTAADGDRGLQLAFEKRPHLIVLDIMLPDMSGLDVLRQLRRHGEQTPVLILSARGSTPDKVEGLKLGADDYLAKPFDLPELLARVDAMLRRRRIQTKQPDIKLGAIEIAACSRRVRIEGQPVAMTAREFDLLYLLASAPGTVFTRDTILERIWGWDYEGTARTVDNFVANLRKKIEPDPGNPIYLHTVPRMGYRMEFRNDTGQTSQPL